MLKIGSLLCLVGPGLAMEPAEPVPPDRSLTGRGATGGICDTWPIGIAAVVYPADCFLPVGGITQHVS